MSGSLRRSDKEQSDLESDLDTAVREGTRRMLVTALEAEVGAYIEGHAGERDGKGHALVVRNGTAQPRRVTTASGELETGGAVGERPARGVPFQQRHPTALGAASAAGDRRAAGVVFARDLTKDLGPPPAAFFGNEARLSAVDAAAADAGMEPGAGGVQPVWSEPGLPPDHHRPIHKFLTMPRTSATIPP